MTFDGATDLDESSIEEVAIQNLRKLVDEKRAGGRKHFLDAYAEHLEALKRKRSAK